MLTIILSLLVVLYIECASTYRTSQIPERSYHHKPISHIHHPEDTDKLIDYIGEWDPLKPMVQPKDTLWSQGPRNFTTSHLEFARYKADNPTEYYKDKRIGHQQLIHQKFVLYPVVNITDFYNCPNFHRCTMHVSWKNRWIMEPTSYQVDPEEWDEIHRRPSFSPVTSKGGIISFKHSYYGPARRQLWMKRIRWKTLALFIGVSGGYFKNEHKFTLTEEIYTNSGRRVNFLVGFKDLMT